MDLDTTAATRSFRDRAQQWLSENVPSERAPDEPKAARVYELEWQRLQHRGGWAGVAWPAEYGGLGLSLAEQLIWYEEYALAGAPSPRCTFVGLRHAGPTLVLAGTEEQKTFHLSKILRGEVVWCQGFSEPSAGSDLAGLRTRGVVDGAELVVSGQKIWTSYGDVADYQELLVRTDEDSAGHGGITWVICDMRSPGIEVRPIRTISGGADFCEVFYDAVRIPLSNVVGQLGAGWGVAMSTLAFERGTAFMAEQVGLDRKLGELVELAREIPGPDGSRPAFDDDEIRRRLARASAEVAALRAMTYLGVSRAARSSQPGPEASMTRLLYGELEQRVAKLAVDICGPATASRTLFREPSAAWMDDFLWAFQATIAAGTKDIQRNIIGERLLGLPR